MNDQQRIDILNTIINQYESAVWLRDALKDVLKYREEMGGKEAQLKEMDDHLTALQADFAGLSKKYKAKEMALEQDLDAVRQTHVATLAQLRAQADDEANHLAGHKETLQAQIESAQDTLAKLQASIAEHSKKLARTEAAHAEAIKK